MSKKKNILRIGTLITLLMFLLIPLMSSPVAARTWVDIGGGVMTNNTGAGPTAGGTLIAPSGILTNSAPFDVAFNVSYAYQDSNGGGAGSDHWMTVTVSWQPGGIGGWSGPTTYTQTPKINIGAGMGSNSGIYSTPYLIGYGGPGTNFIVEATVTCEDIATTEDYTWATNQVSFTI